jgi:hypothetical protein
MGPAIMASASCVIRAVNAYIPYDSCMVLRRVVVTSMTIGCIPVVAIKSGAIEHISRGSIVELHLSDVRTPAVQAQNGIENAYHLKLNI